MSSKISLDRLTLERLYKKHKDYLIPIVTIIVCFILLLQVTIPQIGFLSAKQEEVSVEKAKLKILNNNLNILSNLNDSTLNSQFALATAALPVEKNFAGILNTINLAASKAGVFLGDFEFQVGDVTKVPPGGKTPVLQLMLFATGGANGTLRFVNELYKSLPLSEALNIEINNSSSTITIVFYYKPLSGVASSALPMSALSKTDLDILREISSWNNPGVLQVPLTPIATQSGTTIPSSPF